MKYQIKLNYAEVNLKVAVKTDSPQKLRLKVYDATNPNRVFTNRYKTVTGEENLFVRMPLSPETAVVEVVADKALAKKGEKDNFEFISVEKQIENILATVNMVTLAIQRFAVSLNLRKDFVLTWMN